MARRQSIGGGVKLIQIWSLSLIWFNFNVVQGEVVQSKQNVLLCYRSIFLGDIDATPRISSAELVWKYLYHNPQIKA